MSTATPWVNLMLDGDSSILLVALLAAFAFAGVIFSILYPYVSGDRQAAKRVASVTDTARLKKSSARTAADVAAQRKKQVTESLKDMELRAKSREKVTLRTQLERAGLDVEPRAYWIASIIAGIACGVAGLVFVSGPSSTVAAVAGMLIGGLGLPRLVLSKLIKRRQKKFQSNWPMRSTSSCAALSLVCP